MARVVVVTGANAGIGRAVAQAFADDGWSVGILARDADRLRSAEDDLRLRGAHVLSIAADVADAEAVEAAAARFEQELGPIDVWVNNAMATVIGPARDVTPEEFARVTEVNYLGYVHGTRAALQRMAPRNAGSILHISSALAFRPIPLQSAYCATKSAGVGFVDSLRTELAHDGVKVHLGTIYLPAVNTPQPLWSRNKTGRAQQFPGEALDPRQVAQVVRFAADHPRREVWIGRTTLAMAIGQWLAPSLMDWYLGRKMWDAQLADRPPANPEGNLFAPVAGDFGIDGPARVGEPVEPSVPRHAIGRVVEEPARSEDLAGIGLESGGALGGLEMDDAWQAGATAASVARGPAAAEFWTSRQAGAARLALVGLALIGAVSLVRGGAGRTGCAVRRNLP